jgi:hypothetical protein
VVAALFEKMEDYFFLEKKKPTTTTGERGPQLKHNSIQGMQF